MKEEAVLFGQTRYLVGIITDPPEATREKNLPAIILLNTGIFHHRIGPHRLYVKMARDLSAKGFVVIRFDFAGTGDSKARDHRLSFEESVVRETQEAMDCLRAARGVERFVLIGLCLGAMISLKTACVDPRVVGAVLINAQGCRRCASDSLGFHIVDRKLARYYWMTALSNPSKWWKVINRNVHYKCIIRATRSLFTPKRIMSSRTDSMAADLHLSADKGIGLFLICSERDPALDYIHAILGNELRELSSCGKLKVEVIPQADHTFTLLQNQEYLLKAVHNWAHAMWPN